MIRTLLFLLFTSYLTFAHGQAIDWIHGVQTAQFSAVATDTSGNSYLSGTVRSNFDTLNFNGTKYASANVSSKFGRIYLAKIDSNSNLVWCKIIGERRVHLGGTIRITNPQIVVDHNQDIIFDVYFRDTLQVENDTMLYASNNIREAKALIKLDPNGQIKWAYTFSRSYAPCLSSICIGKSKLHVDSKNNIYYLDRSNEYIYSTSISDLIKFSPGGSVIRTYRSHKDGDFTVDKHQNVYVGWSSSDTFMVVYDSNGIVLNTVMSSTGKPSIERLEMDERGNMYVLGRSSNSFIRVGGKQVGSNLNGLVYLLKMNKKFKTAWIQPIYGGIYDLKVNHSGLFFTGPFGKLFIYNFQNTYVGGLKDNAYLAKVNFSGGLEWVKAFSTTGSLSRVKLSMGPKGSIYSGLNTSENSDDSLVVDHHVSFNTNCRIVKLFDYGNLISGVVYIDSNGNNFPDVGDRFMPNQNVSINDFNVFSDPNGFYTAIVGSGLHVIDLIDPVYSSSTPLNHKAKFNYSSSIDDNNNFRIQHRSNILDSRIVLTPRLFRASMRDSTTRVHIVCSNMGTVTENDTIILQYDSSLLNFDSSSVLPFNISGNTVTWVAKGLKTWEKVHIWSVFAYKSNATLGDTLRYVATVYPLLTDSFPIDNRDSAEQLVVAAYDPNDKQVSPPGDVLPDFIQEGKYFQYTVRFQNTGNDTALTVRIRDTISPDLNMSTFEVLAASHPYRIVSESHGVIDFIFDEIYLPDSNVNEPMSHGYIKYRIKGEKSLGHGDYVENRAFIYFDNNEAIETNTTHTDIVVWAGIEEGPAAVSMLIYPNPTSDQFTIHFSREIQEPVQLSIYDLTGRVVHKQNDARLNGDRLVLNGISLDRGVYIVESVVSESRYSAKLVVE